MLVLSWRFLVFFVPIFLAEVALSIEASSSEVTHSVDSELHQLANTLDWVLGGTRADDIRNSSTLRVLGSTTFHEHHKPDFGSTVRFNTQIGTLERWKKRALDWAKKEEELIEQKVESTLGVGSSEAEPGSGQKGKKAEVKTWSFGFDKRIRFLKERLGGMIAGRARADLPVGNVLLSPAFELGWDSKTLWRSTAQLDVYVHVLRKTVLILGGGTTHQFFHSTFSYVGHASIGYVPSPSEVFTLGISTFWNPPAELTSREVFEPKLVYRSEVFIPGLFLGLSGSIMYPSREDFQPFPSVMISLEKVF